MICFEKKPCLLIAEDDMTVAMLLEEVTVAAGYRVLMVARLRRGLELVASEAIEVAILDIDLAGEASFPLADALQQRGIPFIFASGFGRDELSERHNDAIVLEKPYSVGAIREAIAKLLALGP